MASFNLLVLLLFSIYSVSLASETESICNSVVPNVVEDCIKIKVDKGICCFRSKLENEITTKTCESHDASFSGKSETSQSTYNNKLKKEIFNCNIPTLVCGDISPYDVTDCSRDKLPVGQCCWDHKYDTCLSYPPNYSNPQVECSGEKNNALKIIGLLLFALLL